VPLQIYTFYITSPAAVGELSTLILDLLHYFVSGNQQLTLGWQATVDPLPPIMYVTEGA